MDEIVQMTSEGRIETGLLASPEDVSTGRWQVLKSLTDEEFAALKHGLAEDGIVSSIVLSSGEDGEEVIESVRGRRCEAEEA